MSNETLLLQTADVLEKAAAYIDHIESSRVKKEHETKTKQASDLAQKLSHATGTPMSDDMVNKLAELSPDMQTLIAGLAGSGNIDSLGGPPEGETKQASVGPGMPSGDERFINWVLGN